MGCLVLGSLKMLRKPWDEYIGDLSGSLEAATHHEAGVPWHGEFYNLNDSEPVQLLNLRNRL